MIERKDGYLLLGQNRKQAVLVPRGVANSYQALEDHTVYTYLVNDHWSPEARSQYTYVNLFDPALGIAWPISEAQAEISDADRAHPLLADVTPMRPAKKKVQNEPVLTLTLVSIREHTASSGLQTAGDVENVSVTEVTV